MLAVMASWGADKLVVVGLMEVVQVVVVVVHPNEDPNTNPEPCANWARAPSGSAVGDEHPSYSASAVQALTRCVAGGSESATCALQVTFLKKENDGEKKPKKPLLNSSSPSTHHK